MKKSKKTEPSGGSQPKPKGRINRSWYTSDRGDWGTPRDLFDWLNGQFNFTLDVCANETNHKCERYFDAKADGLTQNWGSEVCWQNPPYGGDIYAWMAKAMDACRKGATVVCLVPNRSDTAWWQDHVPAAAEVWLLRGRLRFTLPDAGGKQVPGDSAPFPSAIVVFRPKARPTGTVLRHVTPPKPDGKGAKTKAAA